MLLTPLKQANNRRPETHHLLGAEEFEILSKHPPLVSNIARGGIIDQVALVDALKSGKLAAATLDVTDPEPLPSDDPLWDAPNIIITPHISGGSSAYQARSFEILELNLVRLEKEKKVLNEISRKKGY
jgi:phosphoglycerate dehydrogenase-like enzyme